MTCRISPGGLPPDWHHIRDFGHEIAGLQTRHVTRLLIRPHAIEITMRGIDRASDNRVAIPCKFTNTPLWIGQTKVPVVTEDMGWRE